MKTQQSTIRAFQKVLSEVKAPSSDGLSFDQQFALKRFAKKFEIPDSSSSLERKNKTFHSWVEYDASLKPIRLPHGVWYRARLKIHEVLRDFRFGELAFTGGSQSEPLHGYQSVADKLLTHDWECSPDCADLFVDLAVKDKAIVKAAKIRMRRSMSKTAYARTVSRIWSYRKSSNDVKRYSIYWNLTSREASRYSTVRKNNEIDRSIDLQQFANMMVQRAIGLGLREVIKNHFGVDLTTAQETHGRLVRDHTYATIDLKNASDSNTWSLGDFLCPKWFMSYIRKATPPYTEGLDGHYYVTNKISSMGNGFTFELMTLFLLAAVREFDSSSSVYGDDIIVKAERARDFITCLESAGWVVNDQKSFIEGPFRESCGYNHHKEYGYIRSYDFEWPETIGDCVTFWNKCVTLSHIPFFRDLLAQLKRIVPKAWRGPQPSKVVVGPAFQSDVDLSSYFWFDKPNIGDKPAELSHIADAFQWPRWFHHRGFEYRAKIRFTRRKDISMRKHSLLYFTYLNGGRVSDITLTGEGDWVEVGFISNGDWSSRIKSLVKLYPLPEVDRE